MLDAYGIQRRGSWEWLHDFVPTKSEIHDFILRWKTRDTEEGEVIFCTLTFTQTIIYSIFGKLLFQTQPALNVLASLGGNKAWAVLSFCLLSIRVIGLVKRRLRARKLAAFLSMFFWYISAFALLKGGALFMGLMYFALATNTAGVFLRLAKRTS